MSILQHPLWNYRALKCQFSSAVADSITLMHERNQRKSWPQRQNCPHSGSFAQLKTIKRSSHRRLRSPTHVCQANSSSRSLPSDGGLQQEQEGTTSEEKNHHEPYEEELEVAVKAVQLACQLSAAVQQQIRRGRETAEMKQEDKSPVTVADWGVQAVISWVLSQAYPNQNISMVAEEDTRSLRGRSGIDHLSRVLTAVNNCLSQSHLVGIPPPTSPLDPITVLNAIQRGTSEGGSHGRHWVLDPVDGTLGFIRGDQYAIALALIDDGKVVLGVLGCPNFPMRTEWLRYAHKYHRLVERMFPPQSGDWFRGCVLRARRGGGGVWMEPLLLQEDGHSARGGARHQKGVKVRVSQVTDPSLATFCEPVEKANSSQEFSQGVATGMGLRNKPLRVYSMAKYAAIARGDAEIFMKFARVGYREKIWDHAAGVILVEEAGGVVTDAGGRPLDFSRGRYLDGLDRGIIASCGAHMHDAILSSVEESWNCSKL